MAHAQHLGPGSFLARPECRQQLVCEGSIGQTWSEVLLATLHCFSALSLTPRIRIYVMKTDNILSFLRGYPG